MTFPQSHKLIQKYLTITRLETLLFMGEAGPFLPPIINDQIAIGSHPTTIREASHRSQSLESTGRKPDSLPIQTCSTPKCCFVLSLDMQGNTFCLLFELV